MRQLRKLLALTVACTSLLALAPLAQADPFTWEFKNGGGFSNSISGSGTSSVGAGNTSLGGLNVTYTAWANTGGYPDLYYGMFPYTNNTDGQAASRFDRQTLANWGSHNLGVVTSNSSADCSTTRETCSNNDGSPNHSMDNEDAQEFVLFEFSEAVVLNQLAIGWPDGGSSDTDMTIIAYTGPGALPSLTGLSSADILTGATNDLFYIEHLPNVPKDNYTPEPYGNPVSFNTSDSVSSRYWMVGAYNKHLDGGDALSGKDYMKLALLGGYTPIIPPEEPPVETPEPGPLMILSLGLLGLVVAGRRRRSRLPA